MNMRTMSQRQWRKKAKRGVSPIIATILLVAITVVLAAVLYILISGLTKGPGTTPLGTSLALGSPSEAQNKPSSPTIFYYNFTVQSAGGGIILNNILFQVVTSGGSIVTPTAAWAVNVVGISGAAVGTYSFSSGTWTSGGSTSITSAMTFSLNVPATLSAAGDKMNVVGTGTFQGTVSVSIP